MAAPRADRALYNAAELGDVGEVRELLAKGADVNFQVADGWTPLIVAGKRGHVDACRLLLQSGADVDLACKDGRTPCHFAVAHGRTDVLALLLEHGADTTLKSGTGKTAREEAKRRANTVIHRMVIDAETKPWRTSEVTKALAKAGAGMMEHAQKLSENGVQTMADCEDLTEEDLVALGLTAADAPVVLARLRSLDSRSEVGEALAAAGMWAYVLLFFNASILTLADFADLEEADLGEIGVDAADRRALMARLGGADGRSEVGQALGELGLDEYREAFWLGGRASFAQCAALDDAALKELGVASLPHRRKLLARFGQAPPAAKPFTSSRSRSGKEPKKRASLAKRLSRAVMGGRSKGGEGEGDGEGEGGAGKAASQFDVFLTHDWGEDELGRDNHARCKAMNAALRREGLSTWFDEERLNGRIDRIMADGIASSRVVLVFVTQRYMGKVASDGFDNCEKEFGAATRMRKDMVPVVMEPRMSDTSKWQGPLQLNLGGHLFESFTDDATLDASARTIAKRVRDLIARQELAL